MKEKYCTINIFYFGHRIYGSNMEWHDSFRVGTKIWIEITKKDVSSMKKNLQVIDNPVKSYFGIEFLNQKEIPENFNEHLDLEITDIRTEVDKNHKVASIAVSTKIIF